VTVSVLAATGDHFFEPAVGPAEALGAFHHPLSTNAALCARSTGNRMLLR
jgi:hypothetical protein